MPTVLYSENNYPDDSVERAAYGPDVKIVVPKGATTSLADLTDEECAQADGLMILRFKVTEKDLARFPKLRFVCRMGVGYDGIDRVACAKRQVVVLNVPDYGTTEVADHAITLALTLRRGVLLHLEQQRADPPAAWRYVDDPLVKRSGVQTFGIVGMGRIATAVALRAKAFSFRVVFHDPYLPNGAELGLGIHRAKTLEELLRQTDTLSVHTPLKLETRGMLGLNELSQLPKGAVVVNTARGPIVDIDALATLLKSGHLSGVGLDVIPGGTAGRTGHRRWFAPTAPGSPGRSAALIITPHSAFYTPQAWDDIRSKGAETMAAALLGKPQNVIAPDSY